MSTTVEVAKVTQKKYPVAIGCGLYAAITVAVLVATYVACGHRFIYPLDDAYISMSIAKHLALGGVWGTSYQFASAASSPGFICILAVLYKLFGVNQYVPLIVDALCCFGIVFATARLFRRCSPKFQTATVCLVVALTPLWTMTDIGMEHALQILLCLIFLDLVAPAIAFNLPLDWRVLTIAALMCSVRYECLFVAAGACLMLAIRRRKMSAIVLGCSAWLPVLIFGLYFKAHGGEWLPNSLLLKGGAGIDRIFGFMGRGLYLAPLMFLITWLVWRNRRVNSPAKAAVCITAVAMWMHLCFADYGWCYRYEAYLIALGIVSLLLCYREGLLPEKMRFAFAIAVGFLCAHAYVATVTLPGRSDAIYSQQMQTAKLLRIYPVPTALNDIGAPTYFTDTPVLDLVGLGSQDVFRARYKHPYTTSTLQRLLASHKIQTIAVYDTWFRNHPAVPFGGPPLPPGYVLVARMYTPAPDDYLGNDVVSYYAARGSEAKLRAALRTLASSLPPGNHLAFPPHQFVV